MGSHLTAISTHINNNCRSSSRTIQYIGKIRKFLSISATERLIHALISSKLDYCNGIFYGLPSFDLEKLQRLQNTAARLPARAKKSAHITSILKNLHRLPVKERIIFKILLVTCKVLHGFAPAMQRSCYFIASPSTHCGRVVRICCLFLGLKRLPTATDGVSAPRFWNDLPNVIKQYSTVDCFKSRLNTFLFKRAFSD